MHRYSGARPRYPQRKKSFRLPLLVALPVLLAFALALTGLPGGNDDKEEHGLMQKDNESGLVMLSPDEAYPAGPLGPELRFESLRLEKSKRRLSARAGGRIVRVYLVALGENPVGPKEVEGDKRTPEGEYRIDGKNPDSAYYKNLGISYPEEKDRKRAKELGQKPGGDIKIHGLAPDYAFLGQAHRISDWTHGCVAVDNDEMEELYNLTPVGIPIVIVP